MWVKLKFFRTRVRDSHQGCQAAACTGSALSKFCLSVGEGATYVSLIFGRHLIIYPKYFSYKLVFIFFFYTIFFYHKKCSFIIFSCQSFSGDIFTSNYCHCCQFCHYCHNYYHRYSLHTKIMQSLNKKIMQPPEK